MAEKIIRRAYLEDEFEGFDEEALFELSDGTFWVQDEYRYWYFYAYRPEVELFESAGSVKLRVTGQSESVRVRNVQATVSRVVGEFKGWEGSSSYPLENGQVWTQSRYKYEYKYAFNPKAVVYDSNSGMVMTVARTTAHVRRTR
ncbi:MAG TPA: hypothetical protein VFE23_01685 [Usitatibacter sp.]|jgi:hypothetical protein|nr:hypothetical protein [Usitatibacter sp.]